MNNTPKRPELAIFDLDNTLLNGDSDLNWGLFLADKGVVDADAHRQANEDFYRQYHEGTLNINEFLAFALKPLSEHPMYTLLEWRKEFMQERIEPIVLPKAEALVEQHRAKGRRLLIITATNRFVTEPIAARFGIGDLLATDAEIIDGCFSGRVQGTPCYQEGKISRLHAWLKSQQIDNPETWFYSDSHNDIPLLSEVDHPVAVDPDAELQLHAKRHGWQQISLRN